MRTIGTEPQRDKYRNHAQVWELLPWHINGSLSAEERQRVSEHVAVCLICRKELGLQSALRGSVKNYELDEFMVKASFERLSAQLHDQDVGRQIPRFVLRERVGKLAGALKSWLRQQFKSGYLVAAASVLAIAAILLQITTGPLLGNHTFKTLSNRPAEAPTADLRLIFADGVSASERQAILGGADLSIVSGPDERGLYFVTAGNASKAALETTLQQLHRDAKILFAELAIGATSSNPPPEEP
jgi:hypothetical protein